MEECPICMSNCSLSNLDCGHSFCNSCLSRWTITCPICRRHQSFSIRLNNFILDESNVKYIDININSPKGESLPIDDIEINKLKGIFGNFNVIEKENVVRFDKLLIQEYRGNCWYIGVVKKIEENEFEIDNTIFLKRNSGSIYYTQPSFRKIKIHENDSFFKLI